jgi:hypothetical protein
MATAEAARRRPLYPRHAEVGSAFLLKGGPARQIPVPVDACSDSAFNRSDFRLSPYPQRRCSNRSRSSCSCFAPSVRHHREMVEPAGRLTPATSFHIETDPNPRRRPVASSSARMGGSGRTGAGCSPDQKSPHTRALNWTPFVGPRVVGFKV